MKIVLLDTATLGSDLNLSIIENEGKLTTYQTTKAEETIDRIKNADIIITNKVIIGEKEMESAKNLKLICVAATGTNNIDIAEAKKRNIVVANVKGYSTEAVAQHTISMILALQNSLIEFANESKSGNWSKSPIFTMLNHPFYELKDKKLGIIGYGTIGKRVAEMAKVFGMKILIGKRKGVNYTDEERVDFDVLIKESDVITVHTPLSENTRNLFAANEFKQMKSSAVIINTARGGIINEADLYSALKNKDIRAAAIDVTEKEPIPADHPLLTLGNIIITPHIAWTSVESRKKLLEGIIYNIQMFKEGKGSDIMVS
ncbi:MAG: hydroxyacid dehydrogenase [Bacteroidetes bacterium]|nr:MAG: hydroxyacid dehydrogenase [Bacteroidota bacterium]